MSYLDEHERQAAQAVQEALLQCQQKLFEATQLFAGGEALEFDQRLRRRHINLQVAVHELEVKAENLARDIQKKL